MAYQDAFQISSAVDNNRLSLAQSLINDGSGVVIFNGVVALRQTDSGVICEVLHSTINGDDGYATEVYDAQNLLCESVLWSTLSGFELEWIVVEGYGMGAVKLWPNS
jgi:hypothetical protein